MTVEQKTILIIDDEPLVRELCSEKFEKAGYAVRTSKDGTSGLYDALSFRPDLIILDMLMPHMTGYDVLKKIRAEREWGMSVPVIVLTNDLLDKDDEIKTIETSTPAFFLSKTEVTPEELLTMTKKILAQKSPDA